MLHIFDRDSDCEPDSDPDLHLLLWLLFGAETSIVSVAKLVQGSPMRGNERVAGGVSPRIRLHLKGAPAEAKRLLSPFSGLPQDTSFQGAFAPGYSLRAAPRLKRMFRDRN